MSHLLETVNPEAADLIGNPAPPPGIGSPVVYVARAGFMRRMRTEFPAVVLAHREDGSVDLYVTMDMEDCMVEERVHFQSHSQPYHCWKIIEDQPAATDPTRLNRIRKDLDKLRQQVVGEYTDVPKSVYDILSDFEDRLLAVERVANDAIGRLREAGLISGE